LLRTRQPSTFNEKVRYKMLRDHRPLLVTFADKVAVRVYVAEAVGAHYLPAAYALLDEPRDLVGLELPESFVVKPTHGSGAVVVVSPRAPADAKLPELGGAWIYAHVRPDAADREHLARVGAEWLEQLYGQGPNREWAYGPVPRRLIVEELLTGPDGGIPDDYKLFVFNQRCRYIQVDTGRFGGRTQDFYRPDWEHVPMSGGPPWAPTPQLPPDRLAEMIDLAERLSAQTDFVRVDLYVLPDRIVVGELTSYPAGGHSPFIPESFNAEFGTLWTVPKRYAASGPGVRAEGDGQRARHSKRAGHRRPSGQRPTTDDCGPISVGRAQRHSARSAPPSGLDRSACGDDGIRPQASSRNGVSENGVRVPPLVAPGNAELRRDVSSVVPVRGHFLVERSAVSRGGVWKRAGGRVPGRSWDLAPAVVRQVVATTTAVP